MDYRSYILDFMTDFAFSREAIDSLMQDYDTLHKDPTTAARFQKLVKLFDRDLLYNYSAALDTIGTDAEACGVQPPAAHLLFGLCLSRHAKELYEQRGIDLAIWRNTMMDLQWKMAECKQLHGYYGSVSAYWFERFIRLDRFGLGRFQFEPILAKTDYEKNGRVIRKGDVVINIHIPSSGPMTRELSLDSFRKAEAFFKDLFPDSPVPFTCDSWLLYPEHENMLEETTNIRKFMSFFDIVESCTNETGSNLWRIFYKRDCSDPAALPQETSLQRAYVKLLLSGKLTGSGLGYFFMDKGEIL